MKSKANGYGWQFDSTCDIMLYKGEQRNGVYEGYGELLKEEVLQEEEDLEEKEFDRIYLGEFSDGKPQG